MRPAGGAGFEPCGLVDLVAQSGDLGASGGDDAGDVQRCAPMQTSADADRTRREAVPFRDLVGGSLQRACSAHAGSCGRRF